MLRVLAFVAGLALAGPAMSCDGWHFKLGVGYDIQQTFEHAVADFNIGYQYKWFSWDARHLSDYTVGWPWHNGTDKNVTNAVFMYVDLLQIFKD